MPLLYFIHYSVFSITTLPFIITFHITPLAFTLLYSVFHFLHYFIPLYYDILYYSPFLYFIPVPYSVLCILHLYYSTLLYYYIPYYSTCLLFLNPLPIFYLSTHYYTCYTPILHLIFYFTTLPALPFSIFHFTTHSHFIIFNLTLLLFITFNLTPQPSFTFCFFFYSPSLYPNIPPILFKLTTLPYFKIPSHFPDLFFLSLTFLSLYYIPPITTFLFITFYFYSSTLPLLYSTFQLSLLLHSPLLSLYPIPQHSFSIAILSFI